MNLSEELIQLPVSLTIPGAFDDEEAVVSLCAVASHQQHFLR